MELNPIKYIKQSIAELRKVIWPSRAATIRLTLMVIVVSVIVGAYITGLDALFAKITGLIIK